MYSDKKEGKKRYIKEKTANDMFQFFIKTSWKYIVFTLILQCLFLQLRTHSLSFLHGPFLYYCFRSCLASPDFNNFSVQQGLLAPNF